MVKELVTDFHARSVYDIDISRLVDIGVKVAFIDLDNTLAQFNLLSPEKRTYELINEFRKNNIEVVIVSNNREKRVYPFVSKLKVKYISSCRKPLTRKLKKYIVDNCLEINDSIIIGDQLLTDALLARRLGIKMILTEPISKKEQLSTYFNRLLDRPLRKKYLSQNRLGRLINKKEGEIL